MDEPGKVIIISFIGLAAAHLSQDLPATASHSPGGGGGSPPPLITLLLRGGVGTCHARRSPSTGEGSLTDAIFLGLNNDGNR